MKNHELRLSLIIGAYFLATSSFAQTKQLTRQNFVNPFQVKTVNQQNTVLRPQIISTSSQNKLDKRIETTNGSFAINIEKLSVNKSTVFSNLNLWLGLNKNFSFKEVSERTDELGFSHTNYQQLFKGFPVENFRVMLHSKNGVSTSLNGQIAEFENIDTNIAINYQEALISAKNYLEIKNLINDYPIETVVVRMPTNEGLITRLAHRVRIDSFAPSEMCYVYVDAQTGQILNKINLNAHVNVPGTGQTLYSGTQGITVDSHQGQYRLRDNIRNIETYDATNSNQTFSIGGFLDASDFVSSTSNFTGVPKISSFTISTVAQNWWFTSFADESPDLYFKIKNGLNQVVYTSSYNNNINPPTTFNNLNIALTNPPYVVEIWDYDAVGGDDFGGSYTVNSAVGINNWLGNGNSGSYTVSTSGNPALDVHWGMEKTFDFYTNVFSRNSYDGNGSVLKQYINPPTLQSQYGNSPNNASAFNPPYNFMQYGLGNGITMNPVVALDVAGHEFTHMVVANNGNGGLVYQGESGALNESFADIFGTCIEFYSGLSPDWTIGEDVMILVPFLRSMSNPNLGQDPDTYNGSLWVNPANLSIDQGGVHINSGVQNYWFYLLSQGGAGTNDLNNNYSVIGIGISQARQIAYRTLVTYLSPNATFIDAYNGSLQATQDLYGNPSAQYTAVKQAWYAVGIGNDPNSYCSGTTELITSTGMISDGSGTANYNNNANCTWVIAPPGATQISLNFTAFATEINYDKVFVYDGPDDTFPLLATWWGNTLPPTITTSAGVGAMTIKFITDFSENSNGWSANYTSITNTPSCDGVTILSSPTGSLSDGSGNSNYGNNQQCYWIIAPPCANSVTLSFSQFNTEQNHDGIIVYDGWDSDANIIAIYSGSVLPSTITSTTGKMMLNFLSDYSTSIEGFTANYTSTGSANCSGITILNSADAGEITDGSGDNNYCSNQDCTWLIQPPQATSVTLNFNLFDLEPSSIDGQTITDVVEVYDGSSLSATLLGKFTGNNFPPSVTSSTGSILVRFKTNLDNNSEGFSASYTSTQNSFCENLTSVLTSANGTFTDGSGVSNYANNSTCSWLIQPANASSITLSFSEFDTENTYDGLIIYDGVNNSAPIIAEFTGSTIPSSVTSSGGSLYIEFITDMTNRQQGWTGNYTSQTLDINEIETRKKLTIFPNPAKNYINVTSNFKETLEVGVYDVLGKAILLNFNINNGINEIDVSSLISGVYLLKFKIGINTIFTEKFIIEK